MGIKNKNSNRVTGKSVTLLYNNLNKDALDSLSTGTFFSTINLPGDTIITEHKVLEKTNNSLTIYIRLNKKVGFNINYFTLQLNNNEYLPTKKTSPVSPKSTPTPPKNIASTSKRHLKYDYNYYRCIKIVFDGTPLYYTKKHNTNTNIMGTKDLNLLLKEIELKYPWKTALKHLSVHIENKNLILSYEYIKVVRYTTPPTKPIPTHKGYLQVLSYDLKCDPVSCVNTALSNGGVVRYDFPGYDPIWGEMYR